MKKVYSLWIMPKAPKRKDGHMNVYETNERIICGTTVEEKEIYDKGVILAIYLNKEHDLNKKYEEHDELLTPLMVLLNNVLDYKGKQRIIEEYGLNTKKIESEVKDMCDLGESIALEARNEGKQIERKEKNIAHVKKLMIGLQMSFKEAINLLEIPEKEVKEKGRQKEKDKETCHFLSYICNSFTNVYYEKYHPCHHNYHSSCCFTFTYHLSEKDT